MSMRSAMFRRTVFFLVVLASAGWEVFGYAAGPVSDCGGEPCPSHMIRSIGAASSEMQPGNAGQRRY